MRGDHSRCFWARHLAFWGVVFGAICLVPSAGSQERVPVWQADFEVDLATLVHHRGWVLPGGETTASVATDVARGNGTLVLQQPREDRQYACIRVPVEPGQRYGLSCMMRTDSVLSREWPAPGSELGRSDWRVLSGTSVFARGATAGRLWLRMSWRGSDTRCARAVYQAEDWRRRADVTIRALIQPYQHGARSRGFACGVVARQQAVDDGAGGNYFVYLSGSGELRIARDCTEAWNGTGTILASAPVPMPARNDRSRPYLLEVVLDGARITARVLQSSRFGGHAFSALLAADEPCATFVEGVSEVTVEDTAYAAGAIGLAGYSSGGNKSCTFLAVEVTREDAGLELAPVSILPRQRGAVVLVDFRLAGGSRVAAGAAVGPVFGTSDWATHEFELSPRAPAGTEALEVRLGIEGRGKVLFDDVRVHGYKPELRALSPVPGAVVRTRRPNLSWEGAFNRYRVELSRAPDLSDDVIYLYTTQSPVRPDRGLTPGEWHWRVRPWRPDRIGFTGAAGPIQSFSVAPDASFWPPAVHVLAHRWRAGPRRPFDVEVRPYRAEFEVAVSVSGVPAELRSASGDRLTFIPGEPLESGLHDVTVTVSGPADGQTVRAEGFLNNTVPGSVSAVNADGMVTVDGVPFFPIGAYRDPSGEIGEFEGAVEAGWNTLFSYYSAHSEENARTLLDGAQAHGMRVMLRHVSGWGHADDASLDLARWVARQSTHPALLAWYLGDEPELYGYTPACVRRMAETVADTDPNTVTTMVSHHVGSFGRMGDIFMPMSYVLGPFFGYDADTPLDARAIYRMKRPRQGIGRAREVWDLPAGKKRPIWAILQGFDPAHGDYMKDREAAIETYGPRSRPTYRESRCMAFAALAYDVQGIFWWFHRRPDLREVAPEAWDGIVKTSRELRDLEPFLVKPKTAIDNLHVPDPLLAWTRRRGATRVLAMINPTPGDLDATIDLSDYHVDTLTTRNPGEHARALPVTDGKITLDMTAHEVVVATWTGAR